MLKTCIVSILLLLSGVFLPASLQARDVNIVNLKTEYTKTPLGIDVSNPRFSWQMRSEKQGYSQAAWQIIVTNESRQVMWNSGRNNSDISLHIKYAGERLQPRTRYHWKLIVWDQHEKKHTETSWFETGLMNPDASLSAWSGAGWIGGGNNIRRFYNQGSNTKFNAHVTYHLFTSYIAHKESALVCYLPRHL